MFFDIILSEDNKIDNNDDYPIEEFSFHYHLQIFAEIIMSLIRTIYHYHVMLQLKKNPVSAAN